MAKKGCLATRADLTGAVCPMSMLRGVSCQDSVLSICQMMICPSVEPVIRLRWSRIRYTQQIEWDGALRPHITAGR